MTMKQPIQPDEVFRPEISIRGILISPGHDFRGRHGQGRLDHGIESVPEVECVAGKGLRGDRYFGFKEDYKGQITFFEWEVFDRLRREFSIPDLPMHVFRRNVLTRGVSLSSLIGKTFEIQRVRFAGTEHCAPCYWMDEAVAPGALQSLQGCGGLRARILTTGVLRVDPGGEAEMVNC